MTSARSWRRRLARVEQERDVLADQLIKLRREAVQEALRDAMEGLNPATIELLAETAKTAAFIDIDGEIDHDAISEFIQPFRRTHYV